MAHVFISGSTGFLGLSVIERLTAAGHNVSALARPASARKLPAGVRIVTGDPLDANTFRAHVAPADTFLHLTGITKPAPWKEKQFRAVDLVSLRESVDAALAAGIRHFIYISVAQPAPVMKAYIRVRQECEERIAQSRIPASILRPWYVLGPGRRWPLMLTPFYKLMELVSPDAARRLGMVTLDQMTATILWAVEHPGSRIVEAPQIRSAAVSPPRAR